MKTVRMIEMARKTRVLRAVWILLTAGLCANAANSTAVAASDAEKTANELFWSALHGADYAAYSAALASVEAAVAKSPEDAVQNAHLGWLHMWHLAEASGFRDMSQNRSADLVSAEQDFKKAVSLEPNEARYLGFYGTTLYVQSALSGDEAGTRRAEATLERAVSMWPEFNLFTAGYIHSSDPYDSPEYATAMNRMWQNLDACAGRHVPRKHPEFAQYLGLATTVGPKRACWNSNIAPHNLEGFFLNFGDMLVKKGDPALARTMYANARHSPTFSEWSYREVLERRITESEANLDVFRGSASGKDSEAQMMVQSSFSCMACHRR